MMIWATVSSRSCIYWLCGVFPSLTTKNIVNLIFMLTRYLVMSICRVISCVVGKLCLLWSAWSLDKTVGLCPASFCTPRPDLPVIPSISWLPTFAFQSPMMKRTFFFLLVLEGVVVFIGLINVSFFVINSWGIDLNYSDVEWLALETNQDHPVVFETAPKYCILDSSVDWGID